MLQNFGRGDNCEVVDTVVSQLKDKINQKQTLVDDLTAKNKALNLQNLQQKEQI